MPNIDFVDQAPWITGRARKIAKKTFHQGDTHAIDNSPLTIDKE
jgi:hypothetical protein